MWTKVFPCPSWASRWGRWPSGGHASMKPGLSSRACGARPSPGWTLRGETASREKGARIGEGRFSRRGAVSAPARYGRTNGKALRCHRWFCDKLVAEARQHLGSALCLLHGRAEPAPPRGASLAKRPWGVNPGITRRVFFSEGRTLCVRVARLNECRGIPFSPDDEARGRLAYRGHVWARPMPPLRACGARPSRGQARQRSPSWKGPGEDKRGGSLGPGSGVLHLCRLHAISFLKVASAHLAFSERDTILTIPVRFD